MLIPLLLALSLVGTAGALTTYGQVPLASLTATAAIPTLTPNQSAAYDTTYLTPPTIPQDGTAPATTFNLALAATNASVYNISIMQHGSFYGFSVEMSVISQLFGRNSTWISPPTLNLMSQLVSRGGGLHIRMGGNTQDYAYMVDHIPNYFVTAKQGANTSNPTQTPAVLYSIDLFYLAANISALVPGVHWYLGIPMNDSNWRLQIAQYGQQIIGKNLIGLQAGNEPDYYAVHGHRPSTYGPNDYMGEFSEVVLAVQADNQIPIKNMFIAPSLATGTWVPDDFWSQTGFLNQYAQDLTAVAMEHYPSNNCEALYQVGDYVDPNQAFPSFLNHQAIGSFLDLYNNTSNLALQKNLPFIMFETNSATCGGLPGLSNSFGAALWALDYGLTMAVRNFSHALLHFGGQNSFYNPITAPPANLRKYNEYTVGAIFYSMLAVAEIFGKSNVSQIVDTSNNGPFNPSYAVYDNGNLDKLVFINFADDATGVHDVVGTFSINGGTVPSQVYVKYLDAASVITRGNITWANQTFGPQLTVDGTLQGTLNIAALPCNTSANTCSVPVKAPQAAVVFLNNPAEDDQAYVPDQNGEGGPVTFETTTHSSRHTATIGPKALATSNGMSGKTRDQLGSTSHGSVSGAERVEWTGQVALLGALVGGGWVVLAGLAVG